MTGGSEAFDLVVAGCARCGKPAKLQCPKCLELKLPRDGSTFCTQECFSASWSGHKSVHLKAKLSAISNNEEGWQYCLQKGQSRTPKMPNYDWTGKLRPFPISRKRTVPPNIALPDWAIDGTPKVEPNSHWQQVVEIKTPEQIQRMREASRIYRERGFRCSCTYYSARGNS